MSTTLTQKNKEKSTKREQKGFKFGKENLAPPVQNALPSELLSRNDYLQECSVGGLVATEYEHCGDKYLPTISFDHESKGFASKHEIYRGSTTESISPSLIMENVEDEEDDSDSDKKRSGRRKIKIEFISDRNRRHITFSKRKAGIMKKAYELSTLTGTQILLLVASETGHVYTFATSKFQPIVSKHDGRAIIQRCLGNPEGSVNEVETKKEKVEEESEKQEPNDCESLFSHLNDQMDFIGGGDDSFSVYPMSNCNPLTEPAWTAPKADTENTATTSPKK